ncbi:MAG: 30S ribosomal protein S20 [Deltaproteobacteria bacterium]|nr:30S ribosomal protein S20 [Deltaproteobacteria bacterium]
MAQNAKQKKPLRTIKISARKRARQNLKARERNRSLYSLMRGKIKELRTSLGAKDKKKAQELLKEALPVIAKMASKGILHKNTAARYASRLTQQTNRL